MIIGSINYPSCTVRMWLHYLEAMCELMLINAS